MRSEKHSPEFDTNSINRAIEKASKDHSFEENNLEKKKTYQITDQTREQPTVRTRPTTRDGSMKEREAVSKDEERKDYPEVLPSAMSNFKCNTCGKQFQNQNDLIQHQRFEGTENTAATNK